LFLTRGPFFFQQNHVLVPSPADTQAHRAARVPSPGGLPLGRRQGALGELPARRPAHPVGENARARENAGAKKYYDQTSNKHLGSHFGGENIEGKYRKKIHWKKFKTLINP